MTCGHLRGLFDQSFTVSTTPLQGAALPPRQKMQAALAAAAGKFRAAQAAEQRQMSPAQQEAFESYWTQRTERAMRAKEAQKEKRQAKRTRDENRAPAATKLWAKAMSLQAAIDTRLSMGARVALQAIRALTAREKRVSRNGLAVTLGVHPRTAQRYLAELRQWGYIRTRLLANRMGWVVAQIIEITEKVMPKHHRPRFAATMADGLARCLSVPENGGSQGETGLSPSKSKYQTTPRGRPGYGPLPIVPVAS